MPTLYAISPVSVWFFSWKLNSLSLTPCVSWLHWHSCALYCCICSKVYFLHPKRKGVSRRICICVPECPDRDLNTLQDLLSYYMLKDIKLCRYDILVDDYRKHYGDYGTTSTDDISCPDLPRSAGYSSSNIFLLLLLIISIFISHASH